MSSKENNDNRPHKYNKPDTKQLYGVYWFYKDNRRVTDIAKRVGLSLSTVGSIIQRIKKTGSPLPARSGGRPYKVDKRAERHLSRIMRNNPSATYGTLQQELADMGIEVHKATVVSAVHRMGLKSSTAAKKSGQSKQQKKKKNFNGAKPFMIPK